MVKYLAVAMMVLGFFNFVHAEQIQKLDIKRLEKIFEEIDFDKPGTVNWCLTKTKMTSDRCMEQYGGKAGILLRLQSYCGATFKGTEVAKIDELAKSAYGEESGMVEIKVDDIVKNLSSLKKNCDSVIRSGSFYVCKKDGKYDYLNSSFAKLSKKSCDQVVVDGKSAYCMKKDGAKYEVIESHIANSTGGATCSQTGIFDSKTKGKEAPAGGVQ